MHRTFHYPIDIYISWIIPLLPYGQAQPRNPQWVQKHTTKGSKTQIPEVSKSTSIASGKSFYITLNSGHETRKPISSGPCMKNANRRGDYVLSWSKNTMEGIDMRSEVDTAKGLPADHLSSIRIEVRPGGIQSDWLFVGDPTCGHSSGFSLSHRSVLLTLRYMLGLTRGRCQVDDKREDPECEDKGDHCSQILAWTIEGNNNNWSNDIPHSKTAEAFRRPLCR